MSQTQITGKFVNAQAPYSTGNFTKQTAIVEIVNGTYVSYLPIEFHNADAQNLFPQMQPNGTYTFTCYVQGTNKTFVDKNGQPTAYITLKCTAVAPAQPVQAPAPQGFQQPQQGVPAFGGQQPAQGFGQQPQQGFAQPQQQGGFIGGQPTQPPFGGTQPPQQNAFAQPAQQQAPAQQENPFAPTGGQ